MALVTAPSPSEFESNMANLKKIFYTKQGDPEMCHMEMDAYILDVLESLGYKDGVHIFRTTPKWYA